MMRLTRVLRGSVRATGAWLAVALILGLLAGGLHHHVGTDGADGCAVCALSLTVGDAPTVVAVPTARPVTVERLVLVRANRPRGATPRSASPRAPPLS